MLAPRGAPAPAAGPRPGPLLGGHVRRHPAEHAGRETADELAALRRPALGSPDRGLRGRPYQMGVAGAGYNSAAMATQETALSSLSTAWPR